MKKNISFQVVILTIGIFFAISGIVGIIFTYKERLKENITTPSDAKIPDILFVSLLALKYRLIL